MPQESEATADTSTYNCTDTLSDFGLKVRVLEDGRGPLRGLQDKYPCIRLGGKPTRAQEIYYITEYTTDIVVDCFHRLRR